MLLSWQAVTDCWDLGFWWKFKYRNDMEQVAGTQTAALLLEDIQDHIMVTATYNGTSWTNIPTCPTPEIMQVDQVFKQLHFCWRFWKQSSAAKSDVNYFNGTTFSPQTSLPATRWQAGGAGTQTSTLIFGGYAGGSPAFNFNS
jgi:hypothetical protein